MSIAPVVRAVTVDTPVDRAFAIFTERIGDWWPLATHTPGEVLASGLAFVDGSLVETSKTGDAAVWGTVTEWDPPRRLALTWSPSGGPVTSVLVDFEPSDNQTRVVLTHVGWEAYGDLAADHRDGYDGEHAWGWILDLFSHAAAETEPAASSSPRPATSEPAYAVAALRSGYENVALAVEVGSFVDPEPGEWNARQVAGHVITNAELMCRVVDDVRARRPAHLDGPDDHAPAAVGRCDRQEYPEVAGDLRRAGAELVARCASLTEEDLTMAVRTYIEHHGEPVVDEDMTVGQLLAAQVTYHLPAHVGQILDLKA
ncbi:MAG: hypothetical protein QOI06_46 [Nocardioidaceae bacterium]|jgi:uncharacterized protein YndB with AHSA1/START domain|nr:hypothetical protein [Nocardioidaceae bacterium]